MVNVFGAHGRAGRPLPAVTRDCGPDFKPKTKPVENLRRQVKESRRKSFMEPRAQAGPQARRWDLLGLLQGMGDQVYAKRGDRTLNATKTVCGLTWLPFLNPLQEKEEVMVLSGRQVGPGPASGPGTTVCPGGGLSLTRQSARRGRGQRERAQEHVQVVCKHRDYAFLSGKHICVHSSHV